jgi:hypothetical protein
MEYPFQQLRLFAQEKEVVVVAFMSNEHKYWGVWSSLDVAITAMTIVYFFWALEYPICLVKHGSMSQT